MPRVGWLTEFKEDDMTVEEFNDTPQGQFLFQSVLALQNEIDRITDEVRRHTEPKRFGSFVDYDDSGFFDNTDI